MTAEIVIILYVAIFGLLGSVLVLDMFWERKSKSISRSIPRAKNNSTAQQSH